MPKDALEVDREVNVLENLLQSCKTICCHVPIIQMKHKFDFFLYCSHSQVVVVAITRVQKSPCQMSFAASAEVQLDGIVNSVKESTENDELLDGENRVPSFVNA